MGLVDTFKSRVEELLNPSKNSLGSNVGAAHSPLHFMGNVGSKQLPIIVFYKVAQLFHHFAATLKELLHENNTFVVLLAELHKRLYQQFLDLCNQQSQQMREEAQSEGSYAILDDL